MEWISVEEKLPDNLSYHLIAWNVDGAKGVSYAMCEIYKDNKWYRNESGYPTKLNNITHWMPFPEPPK